MTERPNPPAPEPGDREASSLGRRLIQNLFVLQRIVGHYPVGHPAMSAPVDAVVTGIAEAVEAGIETRIALQDDFIFFGDQRLKPETGTFEAFEHLVETMKNYGIGALVFGETVTALEIETTVRLLSASSDLPPEEACMALENALSAEGVAGIIMEKRAREQESPDDREQALKERAKSIYSRTLHVVSDVMDEVRVGKSLRLRKAKRVVQRLVDNLLEAETNLLGLTTIRCHDEYTFNHSVNVCILSLAVGQRIGLNRNTLADLGMAALFHDIGKSDVPLQVLNKPLPFDDDEWQVIKRHPVLGVRDLLRLKGIDVLSARIIVGSFEHHLRYDMTGYPDVPEYRGQSLLGRIICIADCYDAMTSSRVYDREALAPEKALRLMLAKSGEHYDPILLKVFVNTVGAYPVGTLCRLDSEELAVVIKSREEPEFWDLPTVRVITGPDGSIVNPRTIDLADERQGRLITGTLDARKEGIDVTAYFL